MDGRTSFRTGDVGAWNGNGELEVRGRVDQQALRAETFTRVVFESVLKRFGTTLGPRELHEGIRKSTR